MTSEEFSASSRYRSSISVSALMSVYEQTTDPVSTPSTVITGSTLTMIQVTVPSGLGTPMTTSRTARCSRRATGTGCSSPGNGEPSRCTTRHSGSSDVRPSSWSMVSPRIRGAASLAATMVLSASWMITPSPNDDSAAR